ncbi:MAG: hypothetical protein V3R94_12885 [Acidobacteriota bacterium]
MKLKILWMPYLFSVIVMTFFSLQPTSGQASLHRGDMTEDVGIKVGEAIPPIRARDQQGNWRDFDSLKGPRGLVISFNRSTDW